MEAANLNHRVKVVYEEDCYLLCGATSPAADTVAVANSQHQIKLYSLSQLAAQGELLGHEGAVRDLRFDPSTPQRLVSCDAQGNVVAWDVRAGSSSAAPLNLDLLAPEEVYSVDISRDGLLLAVGDGHDIAVYDTRHPGEAVRRVAEFHTGEIDRVRFHPTSTAHLCSGADDGLAIFLDVTQEDEDDATVWLFNVQDAVSEFTYLPGPGAGRVAITTACEAVGVYSLETGDCCLSQPRPEEHLYVGGVLPGGEGAVVLWGVQGEEYEARHGELMPAPLGGSPCGSFRGHDAIVRFCLPTPDGRFVTGGEDGFLCLWSIGGAGGGGARANPHRVGAGPARRKQNAALDAELEAVAAIATPGAPAAAAPPGGAGAAAARARPTREQLRERAKGKNSPF